MSYKFGTFNGQRAPNLRGTQRSARDQLVQYIIHIFNNV